LQEKALEQREICQAAIEAAGWVINDQHRNSLRRYFEGEIDDTEICRNLGHNPANDATAIAAFQNMVAPYPMIQHWSANDPNAFMTFDEDILEVKSFFATSAGSPAHPTIALLDESLLRHRTRNKFYHDHHQ
jgi:hypothetical protein